MGGQSCRMKERNDMPNHLNTTAIAGLPHHQLPRSRREFLARAGGGFGALAATYLLNGSTHAKPGVVHPLAAKAPHYKATAKSVIFLFMEGGPSHIDLFDPKPALAKYAGKPLPDSFGPVITAMGEYGAPIMDCHRVFKQHGQSGLWVSDWLPHTAQIVDEIDRKSVV